MTTKYFSFGFMAFVMFNLPLYHEQTVETVLTTSLLWIVRFCGSHDYHMTCISMGLFVLFSLTCIELALADHSL